MPNLKTRATTRVTDGGIVTPTTAGLPVPTSSTGVPASRSIFTTSPLSGGGDLSQDRTISIDTSGFGNVFTGVQNIFTANNYFLSPVFMTNLTVSGTLIVYDFVVQALQVKDLTVSGDLIVYGKSDLRGTAITRDVSVSGQLRVYDKSTVQGVVTRNDVSVSGNLLVYRSAVVQSGMLITVPGTSIIPGVPSANLGLEVISEAGATIFRATRYAAAGNAQFDMRLARGTFTTPAAVENSANVAAFTWNAHDGSDFGVATQIDAFTVEKWTPTRHGTRLRIQTTASGQTFNAVGLIVDHNQFVGIGAGTPAAPLDVQSNSFLRNVQVSGTEIVYGPGLDVRSNVITRNLQASGVAIVYDFLDARSNVAVLDLQVSGTELVYGPAQLTGTTFTRDLQVSGAEQIYGTLTVGPATSIVAPKGQPRNQLPSGIVIIENALGIGLVPSGVNLECSTSLAVTRIGAAQVWMRRARGSLGAPTAVNAGDTLGNMAFGGFDGSVYAIGSQLNAVAAESWTTAAHGASYILQTTAPGSTTNLTRLALTDTFAKFAVPVVAQADVQVSGTEVIWGSLNVGPATNLLTPTGDVLASGMAIVQSALGVRLIPSGVVLEVGSADEGVDTFAVRRASAVAGTPAEMALRRGRGTLAAPTVVSKTDRLGQVTFEGFDGTSFQLGARIFGTTVELWNATRRGTQLQISTTLSGTTTEVVRMAVQHDGKIAIGGGDPTAGFDVQINAQFLALAASGTTLVYGPATLYGTPIVAGQLYNTAVTSAQRYIVSGELTSVANLVQPNVANNTVAEVVVFTKTLPPLSAGQAIRFSGVAAYNNNNGTTPVFTTIVRYGAGTVLSGGLSLGGSGERAVKLDVLMMVSGTSVEYGTGVQSVGPVASARGGGGAVGATLVGGNVALATTSNVAQIWNVSFQHSAAAPLISGTLYAGLLESL